VLQPSISDISDVSPHCGYQLNIHNYVASSVKTLVAASLWHGFPRELVGDHERMMSCGRFSLVIISALNSFLRVCTCMQTTVYNTPARRSQCQCYSPAQIYANYGNYTRTGSTYIIQMQNTQATCSTVSAVSKRCTSLPVNSYQ